MNNGQGGAYPNAYGNQPSYETVTTTFGSGSEPLGYSTDPSSENSSVDRNQGAPNGAGEYGSYNNGNPSHGNGYGPPPPIHKDNAPAPRVPIKLGGSSAPGSSPGVYEPPRPETTKRKSSFFKRFSKS